MDPTGPLTRIIMRKSTFRTGVGTVCNKSGPGRTVCNKSGPGRILLVCMKKYHQQGQEHWLFAINGSHRSLENLDRTTHTHTHTARRVGRCPVNIHAHTLVRTSCVQAQASWMKHRGIQLCSIITRMTMMMPFICMHVCIFK